MKKIVSDCATGLVSIVDLTADEIAEIEAMRAARIEPVPTPAPTKEQLLIEVAALTTKIQALS